MGSPCNGCRRVAQPESCENKNCRPWREWYVACWEQTRRRLLGIANADPCESCACPKGMCLVPCSARVRWEGKQ